MKKLSNTEAKLKKSVAYKKKRVILKYLNSTNKMREKKELGRDCINLVHV